VLGQQLGALRDQRFAEGGLRGREGSSPAARVAPSAHELTCEMKRCRGRVGDLLGNLAYSVGRSLAFACRTLTSTLPAGPHAWQGRFHLRQHGGSQFDAVDGGCNGAATRARNTVTIVLPEIVGWAGGRLRQQRMLEGARAGKSCAGSLASASAMTAS